MQRCFSGNVFDPDICVLLQKNSDNFEFSGSAGNQDWIVIAIFDVGQTAAFLAQKLNLKERGNICMKYK
jgi:hypothetical protein